MPSAGPLPAAVLAQRTCLAELVDGRLTLARHGADSGTKALSVIGSMLIGADSIDDTGVLRAGAMGEVFTDTSCGWWCARVRPTPGSQLALFTDWDYHAFVTDRTGEVLQVEADHRRHAVVEQSIAS